MVETRSLKNIRESTPIPTGTPTLTGTPTPTGTPVVVFPESEEQTNELETDDEDDPVQEVQPEHDIRAVENLMKPITRSIVNNILVTIVSSWIEKLLNPIKALSIRTGMYDYFKSAPKFKITVIVCFFGMVFAAYNNSVSSWFYFTQPSMDFNISVDVLEHHFHSQHAETKTSLRLALKRITVQEPEPGDPSSMIVLIPPQLSSSSFPLCFVKIYGELVNRLQDSPQPIKAIDASSFQDSNISVSDLRDDFRQYFQQGARAVVVQGISKLKSHGHLAVFHTFCDTTHAPWKRTAYFFLVDIPYHFYKKYLLEQTQNYDHDVAKLGNEILEEAWSDSELSWDKIHPLLARIGSWGTILIQEGDTCNYESLLVKTI